MIAYLLLFNEYKRVKFLHFSNRKEIILALKEN